MDTYVVFSQVKHTITEDLDAALRAAYEESRMTDGTVSTIWRETSPLTSHKVATIQWIAN